MTMAPDQAPPEYEDGPPEDTSPAMPCKISLKTFAEDADGWIVHVSIDADDMALGLTMFNGLVQRMKADGYTANTGFETKHTGNRGGGGGQRPEDTPPSDIKVPNHCAEPMIYSKSYTSPKTGKLVNSKFTCRKGAACAEATDFNGTKYGHTLWEDALRKMLEMAGA